MGLSNDLISQFVKITKDKEETKHETIVLGTIVEDENGTTCVKIDGSEILTPVSTTTVIKPGERVTVMIKNHTATITGNISSPSASNKDVKEIGNKISEFEIVIADRITTDELYAYQAVITSLRAQTAKFGDISATNAEIDNLEAKIANLDTVNADDVKTINATIENLQATFANFTDISTDELEALNANIDKLKAYTAEFTYVSADVLDAMKAKIKELDVDSLKASDAKIKYAQIDFANIGEAAVEKFYAVSGIIKNVTIESGIVVKELVGVLIRGDLIEAGTIAAEKLIVKGEDGLYYKLNVDALGETTASSDEKYQNGLDGSVIIAKSVAAEKISVSDLEAFGATIGGFKITENSIYSGLKASVDSNNEGLFLGSDGQISLGDINNYLKYYIDSNGKHKLEITADSVTFKSGQTFEELKESGSLKGEDAVTLRIESSRGTVFKNSAVSTVLSAVIYYGPQRITDITALRAAFGSGAYLEWRWQRMDESEFGVILSTDSRIGNNGFTFTLSPEDVDTKVTFMCQLIT